MSETTATRATTAWHPADCSCGLCRPGTVATSRARLWRPPPLLIALVVALAVTALIGAFVGYSLARPAGLHCIHSHGTSACYTDQSGPGTVVQNTTRLNAYDTPSMRASVECYLEQHGATLADQPRCKASRSNR